jgi:hypothetical protein
MDPGLDPRSPKTYGSGFATLLIFLLKNLLNKNESRQEKEKYIALKP